MKKLSSLFFYKLKKEIKVKSYMKFDLSGPSIAFIFSYKYIYNKSYRSKDHLTHAHIFIFIDDLQKVLFFKISFWTAFHVNTKYLFR